MQRTSMRCMYFSSVSHGAVGIPLQFSDGLLKCCGIIWCGTVWLKFIVVLVAIEVFGLLSNVVSAAWLDWLHCNNAAVAVAWSGKTRLDDGIWLTSDKSIWGSITPLLLLLLCAVGVVFVDAHAGLALVDNNDSCSCVCSIPSWLLRWLFPTRFLEL